MQYLRKLSRAARHPLRLIGYILVLGTLLCSCEGTTFNSSVPTYPVRVTIDTRGLFVNFTPEAMNSYITVNAQGYKENGKYVKPVSAMDAWGYGGVVVYVSIFGYVAFDLACPYCAGQGRKESCEIVGMNAVCPHCGEEYDLGSGYALPRKGISKEAMRKYNITNSGDKLTIVQ